MRLRIASAETPEVRLTSAPDAPSPMMLWSGVLIGVLTPPVSVQAAGLPEGIGREVVEAVCTGCHQTSQITRSSGYTREDWAELIGAMVDLSASPEQRDAIVGYLAAQSPPNQRRAPVLVPGMSRSGLPNGSCRRSGNARAIRSRRPTGRSGGPDSGAKGVKQKVSGQQKVSKRC